MSTPPREQEHERKHFTVSVKDAEKGVVEAVFSTFNVVDLDGDVTLPGAFEDGAKATISDYGHSVWAGGKPVGKGTIRVEQDRAVLEGKFFLSTEHGREAFETVKAMGEMQEWSYGFDVLEVDPVPEEMRQKGVRRILKKLKTYEVSPVFRGAGVNTQTLAVKDKRENPTPGAISETPERDPEAQSGARKEFRKFILTLARLAS